MANKEKSDATFVLLPSPNAESYPQVTSQYFINASEQRRNINPSALSCEASGLYDTLSCLGSFILRLLLLTLRWGLG